MVAAMFGFAVEDMFVKATSRALPPGEVLMAIGLVGTVAFAIMTLRKGDALLPRAFLGRSILIRNVFEVGGRVFYTLSLALASLSSTSAILQAAPLVVVLGAILFFGERVGWRRWTAIFAGFGGVMLILRPGLDGFQPTSILAVLGMIGFAGRDLATRASPPVLSNSQLGLSGYLMILIAGVILLLHSGGPVLVPDAAVALKLLAGGALGTAGYHALTGAMRTGDIGVVTPFRYTRLVFGMIFGILVFGERPDLATVAGAAVIVAAGVYTLLRSRKA